MTTTNLYLASKGLLQMAINFNDPAQTTNQGVTIPINTQAEYDAVKKALQSIYEYLGVPWTADSEATYEQRVRNGQTAGEIIVNSVKEYKERIA